MKYSRSFFYVICLLVLYDFHDNIVFPLTVRLLENAICRQHFGSDRDVRESECKIPEIQSQLAFIRGWYSLFRTVPAILAGPYFGGLADRRGRREVYAMALTGLLLQLAALFVVCSFWGTFLIQFAWLTGIFILIGGGQFVIIGLNLTMVSDICKPEERSQHLYFAFAIRFVADLISPQVASSALEHSLWLPALIAGLCLVASYPILIIMDEPLQVDMTTTELQASRYGNRQSMSDTFKGLLTDWKVICCLIITFLLQFRYINQSILISYASVRFGWSIAQVSRLLSIIPGVSLVIFLALPALHKVLSKRLPEPRQSYFVLEILMVALVAGDALIVAASSMPFLIFALAVIAVGDGIRAPLLAIAATYIESDFETASLYTLLSVTDAFAHVVGDPLLQSIWRRALAIGDRWLVLPFITTLCLFVLALLLSWFLPIETLKHTSSINGEDEEHRPLLTT